MPTAADPRLRAQMVLLAHHGRSVAGIAQRVFRSDDPVRRVLTRVAMVVSLRSHAGMPPVQSQRLRQIGRPNCRG
jgi:hypothetical protein